MLNVDRKAGVVEAEGMTTFFDLADATLAEGAVPCVVPQLKSITLGGAVAGVGIEASSFRFGLVPMASPGVGSLAMPGEVIITT